MTYPAPPWLQYYRYVGPAEAYAVETTRIVMTLSGLGITWYTPDRYLSRIDAQRFLALPGVSTHRLGPYPEDELPPFTVGLRRVQPNFGQPGGGWEAATERPVFVFGVAPLG